MDNNLFVACRLKLFKNINSQPTLYEIITGRASRPIKINTHSKRKRADTVSHFAYVFALELCPCYILYFMQHGIVRFFSPKATFNVVYCISIAMQLTWQELLSVSPHQASPSSLIDHANAS